MKMMKYLIGICIFMISIVSAFALEGGEIIGNSQVFDTPEIYMKVTPHTSISLGNSYVQTFEVRNKGAITRSNVWVAFRFNDLLSQRNICEWITQEYYSPQNDSNYYVNECLDRSSNFQYSLKGNKHYYILSVPTTWDALETRSFDIRFSFEDNPNNAKYDMAIWIGNQDCLIDDSCTFSRILDPYTKHANITGTQYYYSLDDDSISGSVYLDQAGNQDITYQSGATGDTGILNEAYDAAGTGVLNNSAVMSFNEYSLNFWVNTHDWNNDHQQLVNFDVNINGIILTKTSQSLGACGSKQLCFFNWSYASGVDIAWDDSWDDVWTMFTLVCENNNNCKFYANGVNLENVTVAYDHDVTKSWFGASNDVGGYPVAGSLDEIWFTTRAITNDEIEALYNDGAAKAYPFNIEPSVNQTNDPLNNSIIPFTESVNLNVTVHDPDNDNLNVSFFDSTGTLIDYVDDVNASDSWNALVTWTGLEAGVWNWSITVNDGVNITSASFNFTIQAQEEINTSIRYLDISHPDILFSSTTVVGLNFTFPTNPGEQYMIESSLNARRISGTESDLQGTYYVDGVLLGTLEETLVTLSDSNAYYSTGKEILLYNATMDSHNLAIVWSQTGTASINLSNVDVIFKHMQSAQNGTIFANENTMSGTTTTTAETVVDSVIMNKNITSDSYILVKQTYSSDTPDNLVTCYVNETDGRSEIAPRWLQNAGDSGSSIISYIDSEESGDHQHDLVCYQTKTATTTYTGSVTYRDMRDNNNVSIQHINVIGRDGDMSYGAGTHEIMAFNATIAPDGDSFNFVGSMSVRADSAGPFDLTAILYVDGVECGRKVRTLRTINKDVGAVYMTKTCNNLTPGIHNITGEIIVPATESITLLNDSLSVILESATATNVTVELLPPILSQSCSDITLFHSQNLSCEFNATDINNPALDLEWNIDYENASIDSNGLIFDNPTIADVGCRNITATVNNTVGSVSSVFEYCVENRAPSISFTGLTGQAPVNLSETQDVTEPDNDSWNATISGCSASINETNTSITVSVSASTILSETCTVSVFDGLDTFNTTFDISISPPIIDTENRLVVNQCPTTLAGMLNMWCSVAFCIGILILGFLFRVPLLPILSGFGMVIMSYVMIDCNVMMSMIMGAFAIACFVLAYRVTLDY